jgi:hypothetical protein|tara:strand:+ start:218 stop:736 length:519 start_codon:yes stop_codon:yes gene_type:complete
MIEKLKKGRGRPKGAPNKPKIELVTERTTLHKDADVYEILCQADLVAQDNEDFAINGLRVFGETNGAVKPVCQWAFDEQIVSRLPEGKTPYKPNDAPDSDLTPTSLRFEFRKFKYFCTDEIKDNRKQSMWIELMESIPAKEAEVMELVKDKTWPFKNITKEMCQKAFPDVAF